MLEGLFTGYAVRWHPLEHFHHQVRALFNVLLGIVFVWQDLLEVALRRVVKLVNKVNGVLADLRADALEGFAARKTEQSYLLNQLGPLSLAGEKRPESHELSKNAANGPNVDLLSVV